MGWSAIRHLYSFKRINNATTVCAGALAAAGNRLYIAGDFTAVGGVNAQGVAFWNGAAWARLGSGVGPRRQYYGWETGTINALAIAPNGDLYIGGYFSHIDDVPANSIARWDGTRWHAVGGGIVDLGDYEGAEPATASVYFVFGSARTPPLGAGGEARFNAVQCDMRPFLW